MSDVSSLPAPSEPGDHAASMQAMLDALGPLSPDTRKAVQDSAVCKSLPAGTWILHAGDTSDEFYFLASGEVAILQPAVGTQPEKQIATVSAGEFLGEIAMIDGKSRTMSVRAATDVRLIEVAPDRLSALAGGAQFVSNLKAALGPTVVGRIRSSNAAHVESLQREIAAAQVQRQFGLFFVYVMTILCAGMIVSNTAATGMLNIDPQGDGFLILYSSILGIPSVIVLVLLKLPLSDLGLTLRGFRRSLLEGLAISAVLCLLLVAGAAMARAAGMTLDPVPFNPIGALFYFFHSFFQELLGRGVVQSSLQKFFGSGRGLLSVVLASTIFGTMHIHLGLTAVALTFAASVFFGLVFMRHQNLIGVTVIHFMAGAAAFLLGLI